MQSLIITCFCIVLALLSHNANSSEAAVSAIVTGTEQPNLSAPVSTGPQAAGDTAATRLTAKNETNHPTVSSGGMAPARTIATYGAVGAAFLLMVILSRHGRIHHHHGHQHA